MSPQPELAELLGWSDEGVDEDYPVQYWRTPDGHLSRDPDVDDMLAWLRGKQMVVVSAIEDERSTPPLTGEEIDLCVYGVGQDLVYVDGPTLHAALEAAVRAVASGIEG